MSDKKLLLLVIAVIAISSFFLFIDALVNSDLENNNDLDTSDWEEYISDKYDFSLNYPSEDWNWNISPDHIISPRFNFYIKPAGVSIEKSFDHFANITNVSIYPEGIPIEGLTGETKPLEEDWGDEIDYKSSSLYTLEDGTPFAAYVKFNNMPESWEDWGYAWLRLEVPNLEAVCFRSGEEVKDPDTCDPLGDESVSFVYRGDLNEDNWLVLEEILKSVKFNSPR
ncbi:MAG: hypothetical protein WDZ80_01400 [Candidatus Paceibacterota bacterium]